MFDIAPLFVIILFSFPGYPWVWVPAVVIAIPCVYAITRGAPFVPTLQANMDRMFTLAKITKGEKVYDLGCGDGRLVFEAGKRGADAVGYELSLTVYLWAKYRSFFRTGSIRYGDFWSKDVSDADVILCFLTTGAMVTFEEKIWSQLKPGARVVSHAFPLKNHKPADQIADIYLYVKGH